jgi:hypothetical protein
MESMYEEAAVSYQLSAVSKVKGPAGESGAFDAMGMGHELLATVSTVKM